MAIVKAAIIVTGNEILSGKTQDQNAHKIINILKSEKNIITEEVVFIRDNRAEIISKVKTFSDKYDYVFTTGGIGPTHDDITVEAVAVALGVKLFKHPDILQRLENYYKAKGEGLNDARLKMTYVPVGSDLLYCNLATVPGFKINNVIVMAGVPNIMEATLITALPLLKISDKLHTISVEILNTETKIAAKLQILQEKYSDVDIGSYPYYDKKKNGTIIAASSYNLQSLNEVKAELEMLPQEV